MKTIRHSRTRRQEEESGVNEFLLMETRTRNPVTIVVAYRTASKYFARCETCQKHSQWRTSVQAKQFVRVDVSIIYVLDAATFSLKTAPYI